MQFMGSVLKLIIVHLCCTYFRLMRALEEVHRKSAIQEFRRKRDRLALDCGRIGKFNTHKTVRATAVLGFLIWSIF